MSTVNSSGPPIVKTSAAIASMENAVFLRGSEGKVRAHIDRIVTVIGGTEAPATKATGNAQIRPGSAATTLSEINCAALHNRSGGRAPWLSTQRPTMGPPSIVPTA
ncbi:hypothetical protein GCM10028801_46010 [Nocardioides maradonensis]